MDMTELAQRITQENEAKPVFEAHYDPLEVVDMIIAEAHELRQAIRNDGCAMDVGLELGDILYVVFFLCGKLGYDPEDLINLKRVRNTAKYPPEELQEGEWSERVAFLKKRWKERGGDEEWSHTL